MILLKKVNQNKFFKFIEQSKSFFNANVSSHKIIPNIPILGSFQESLTTCSPLNTKIESKINKSFQAPNPLNNRFNPTNKNRSKLIRKSSDNIVFQDYKPFTNKITSQKKNYKQYAMNNLKNNDSLLLKNKYQKESNIKNSDKIFNQIITNRDKNKFYISHGKHYSLNEINLKPKIHSKNSKIVYEHNKNLSSRKIEFPKSINNNSTNKKLNLDDNPTISSSNYRSFHHTHNITNAITSSSPQFLSFHQKHSPLPISNNTDIAKKKSTHSTKALPFIKKRYKSQKKNFFLNNFKEISHSNNKCAKNFESKKNRPEKINIERIRRDLSINSELNSFSKINQFENKTTKAKVTNNMKLQYMSNQNNKSFLNQMNQHKQIGSLRKNEILNNHHIKNQLNTSVNNQIYSQRSVVKKTFNLLEDSKSSVRRYLTSYTKVSPHQNK